MKITMICTEKKQDTQGYHYVFGVKRVAQDAKGQGVAGKMAIMTAEPQHFKVEQEYTVHLSDLITLASSNFTH